MSNTPPQRLALAPWIGLCPALALARTAMDGLALGIAALALGAIVLPALSFVRHTVPAGRWPLTALVLACAAGCVQMLLEAGMHRQHEVLAWGVPLLAANLALWRAAPPFDTLPSHPVLDIVLAAVLVAAMGAVRGFMAGSVWLAGQSFGTLVLLSLVLAARQAWQQRQPRSDIATP